MVQSDDCGECGGVSEGPWQWNEKLMGAGTMLIGLAIAFPFIIRGLMGIERLIPGPTKEENRLRCEMVQAQKKDFYLQAESTR